MVEQKPRSDGEDARKRQRARLQRAIYQRRRWQAHGSHDLLSDVRRGGRLWGEIWCSRRRNRTTCSCH